MPETATTAVLHDVVDYLDGLAQEGASPATACARLAPLRARHPGAEIDVVWEAQAFDGSLHFDALVRPDDRRTISLSVCPDDALPWPLRGLQRWKDSDLLRVDGVVLPVAEAIAQLDAMWERAPLMQRLVDHCLVQAALAREPVDVTDAEVQQALDALRRGRGLLRVADFEAWMRDSGLTWATVESMATQVARTAKLRERTVGAQVDAALAGDLAPYDTLALATVHTRSPAAAEAVRAALAGGPGLLQAAQDAFAAHPGAAMETSVRRVRRHQLDPVLARALADAVPAAGPAAGTRAGPVPTGDGVLLAEVLALEPATASDPGLRHAVTAHLYEGWLRTQRAQARIEWFWGQVHETRPAGHA